MAKVILDERWKRAVSNGQLVSFEVSNYGRVRNYLTNKLVKGYFRKGYIRVKDTRLGKHFSVHRLVLETFRPDEMGSTKDVHHIDHNKTNNILSNLEWISHEEHSKDSVGHRDRNGTHSTLKYTHKQIKEVCKLLQSAELTCVQISKCTGVSVNTIYGILYGNMWVSVSKNYDFSLHKKAIRRTKETLDAFEKCIIDKMILPDIVKRFTGVDGMTEQQVKNLYYTMLKSLVSEGKTEMRYLRKYPDSIIEEACRCLSSGMTIPETEKKTKIPSSSLYALVHGRMRADIASKYDLNKRGVVETKVSKYVPMVKSMIAADAPYGEILATLTRQSTLTEKQIKRLYEVVKSMKS